MTSGMIDASTLAAALPYLTPEERAEAEALALALLGGTLKRYQGDPVAFGRDVLGDTFTPDIERVMCAVRDSPVTIVESANSTGKSHAAARLAVWWLCVYEDGQVYTAAAPPVENLKKILWGEIGSIAAARPDLFAGFKQSALHIERTPKSFLTGVTIPQSGSEAERKAKFSGKHAPHLLFIIDEGDAIPPEIYEAIESCMSGSHVRLVIFFNPRHESGPVYLKAKKGQGRVMRLSAFDHPNVTEGRDVIPGAIDRQTTVRRINEWTRPAAEGETVDPQGSEWFEVPVFLVGETAQSLDGLRTYPPLPDGWRRIEQPEFAYMVLGRYPAQGANQLISRASTDRAVSNWQQYVARTGGRFVAPAGIAPVCGFDVADEGRDSNSICPRYGSIMGPLRVWPGVDADMAATEGLEYLRLIGARAANVDGTGVGAGVAPKIGRAGFDGAHKVMVGESPSGDAGELGTFRLLRDQLLWSLREWLRTNENAAIPPDEELLDEIHALEYSRDEKGIIRVSTTDAIKSKVKRSPDRLMSAAMTFYEPPLPVGPGAVGPRRAVRPAARVW